MKIPEMDNSVEASIDAAHEARKEKPRPHMGVSGLGHNCDRYLWLGFRWAVQEQFPGRILRLFRRGHNEEKTIVSDLRAMGVHIDNTTSNQSRVDFGFHVSGSMDGVISFGVPGAMNTKHILEAKTHALKSFNDVLKSGVQKSKPLHYVQMQVYMLGAEVDRALYYAVCKNDDRIYTERIKLDKEFAQRYVDRGHRIVGLDRMPEPLSSDPSWYECKFCSAHEFCHKTKTTQHVNCRTCAHSTPMQDSTWRCELHKAGKIPVDYQHTGCDSHVLHPDLVPYKRKDGTDSSAIYVIEGSDVINGDAGYKSSEILANPHYCAHPEDGFEELRTTFNGRIVG
jgi:hypothetical protein